MTDLEDRGLLGWDRRANRYDLHPVVRGVVWSGLDDVRRRAYYGQLEQYFSSGPAASEKIRSGEQALSVIELMRALIGLSRYDDAADLYFDRLYASRHNFWFEDTGTRYLNIAILEGLFPAGVNQLPAVRPDRIPAVIAQLGHAYRDVGRLTDAHRCAMQNLNSLDPKKDQSYLYRYVSQRDLQLGHLRAAQERARLAVTGSASWTVPFPFNVGGGDETDTDHWALCEATLGNYSEALSLLDSLGYREYYDPLPSKARVRLWMSDFDQAIQLGQRFLRKKRAAKFPVARMEVTIDMAEAHQRIGHVDLAVGMLMDALREARSKAIAEVELHALRCLADAHRLRGDYTSALTSLNDLDEIAARGPYRLIQADAANIRALLLDADHAQRRAEAERAYKLAWCDGPPFAYHRALELAAGTLRDLDAPLPQESRGTTDS